MNSAAYIRHQHSPHAYSIKAHKTLLQGALNRVAFKHFDYVICRAHDLAVVCVVELNDKSHASARAQSRDALVRKICEGIHPPLLTITAKAAYNVEAIRKEFITALSPQAIDTSRDTVNTAI